VSPSFTEVMSIALLRGRGFDARDREGSTEAVIVNQRFVDEYLADRDDLGARIKLGLDTDEHPWLTIVGVVANAERTNYFNEMSFATQPIVYRPLAQQAERTMTLLIRAGDDVRNLGALLQREAASLDARVPVYGLESMDDVLARTFAQPRLRTRLLGAFAAVAVLLSAIGIYGLLMYSVAQRTREIGIRMALGADRRRVLRSIMAEGLALVAVGAASGLVMSAYLARLIEKILYGVEGLDPVTMAAASAILIAASLIAIYVPARRATRVDPFVALRAE
jgi:putative ABC transport system permease protein